MAEVNHKEREHAVLSASASHRWLHCTPSAKLEEQFGKVVDTDFAQEGTLAHELSEIVLRYELMAIDGGDTDLDVYEATLDKTKSNPMYSRDMLNYTREYIDYCKEQYIQSKVADKGSVYGIEEKLNLSAYVPESFGTADFVVVGDGKLEIIDLKYGAGVAVDAYNNPQLMLYALGCLERYDMIYSIDRVAMTIVQPRMNNISTFELDKQELLDWAESELIPKAEQAMKGEGELHCGKWCQFCKVKERCRELYNKNMSVVNKIANKQLDLLTDDEIAEVVSNESQITSWLKAISEYAREQALSGKKFKGLKLVEGRSIRRWKSESVGAEIAELTGVDEESLYNKKLKGMGDVEKLVGKANFKLLGDLIVKPAGAPTLVSEDDKRPELGREASLQDFGI